MPNHTDKPSTTTVQITVLNLAPMRGRGNLLALADVEVLLDGVSIILHGVQVCATSERTEVRLPKYRGADGTWMTAITLPDEVKGPMGQAVMAAGIEAGVLREKVAGSVLGLEISRETC
jgi:stage V sporulation protein G